VGECIEELEPDMWASVLRSWNLTDVGEWSEEMSEAKRNEYQTLRKISRMKKKQGCYISEVIPQSNSFFEGPTVDPLLLYSQGPTTRCYSAPDEYSPHSTDQLLTPPRIHFACMSSASSAHLLPSP
jgi:hypothetical protein